MRVRLKAVTLWPGRRAELISVSWHQGCPASVCWRHFAAAEWIPGHPCEGCCLLSPTSELRCQLGKQSVHLPGLGCKNHMGIPARDGEHRPPWGVTQSTTLEMFCMCSQRGTTRSHSSMIQAVCNILKRNQQENSYSM